MGDKNKQGYNTMKSPTGNELNVADFLQKLKNGELNPEMHANVPGQAASVKNGATQDIPCPSDGEVKEIRATVNGKAETIRAREAMDRLKENLLYNVIATKPGTTPGNLVVDKDKTDALHTQDALKVVEQCAANYKAAKSQLGADKAQGVPVEPTPPGHGLPNIRVVPVGKTIKI